MSGRSGGASEQTEYKRAEEKEHKTEYKYTETEYNRAEQTERLGGMERGSWEGRGGQARRRNVWILENILKTDRQAGSERGVMWGGEE